jgi:hypothetical protein
MHGQSDEKRLSRASTGSAFPNKWSDAVTGVEKKIASSNFNKVVFLVIIVQA